MGMTRKQKAAAEDLRAENTQLRDLVATMQQSIAHLTGTNDNDATERAISSTVLMSQRVDSGTAPAETGPHEDDVEAAESHLSNSVNITVS
jgi:rhodanese-related sulfurtransferase